MTKNCHRAQHREPDILLQSKKAETKAKYSLSLDHRFSHANSSWNPHSHSNTKVEEYELIKVKKEESQINTLSSIQNPKKSQNKFKGQSNTHEKLSKDKASNKQRKSRRKRKRKEKKQRQKQKKLKLQEQEGKKQQKQRDPTKKFKPQSPSEALTLQVQKQIRNIKYQFAELTLKELASSTLQNYQMIFQNACKNREISLSQGKVNVITYGILKKIRQSCDGRLFMSINEIIHLAAKQIKLAYLNDAFTLTKSDMKRTLREILTIFSLKSYSASQIFEKKIAPSIDNSQPQLHTFQEQCEKPTKANRISMKRKEKLSEKINQAQQLTREKPLKLTEETRKQIAGKLKLIFHNFYTSFLKQTAKQLNLTENTITDILNEYNSHKITHYDNMYQTKVQEQASLISDSDSFSLKFQDVSSEQESFFPTKGLDSDSDRQ